MASGWEHVRTVGSVLSIIGVGAGLAIYFTDFKTRLEKLEGQVQLIAVAPALVRKGSAENFSPDLPPGEKTNAFEPYAVGNPLISTCIDLIKRTASVNERGDTAARLALESLMRDYNCQEVLKDRATK